MADGHEDTPKDVQAVERLKRWAISGAGAAIFDWGTPGDYDKCLAFYADKMSPGMIHGWCATLHKEATGASPGHAPGEEAAKHA